MCRSGTLRRVQLRHLALLAAVVVAGCGNDTAPLPPAATPADSPAISGAPAGRVVPLDERTSARRGLDRRLGTAKLDDGRTITVDPRERRLRLGEEEVPAGVGPTDVAVGDGGRVYVTDTDGGSVLLFRTEPELGLVRRAALPGKPYAAATDREKGKLWVTVTETNEAVQLTADGAPRIQRRFPTVRQPNAIAVDDATGRVEVASTRERELQAFDGYPPTLGGR